MYPLLCLEKGLCGDSQESSDCGHFSVREKEKMGVRGGRQDGAMVLTLEARHPSCGRGGGSPGAEPSPSGEVLLSGEQRADVGLVWTESHNPTHFNSHHCPPLCGTRARPIPHVDVQSCGGSGTMDRCVGPSM